MFVNKYIHLLNHTSFILVKVVIDRQNTKMSTLRISLFGILLVSALISLGSALKEGDCEVCIKTLEKFGNSLDEITSKI